MQAQIDERLFVLMAQRKLFYHRRSLFKQPQTKQLKEVVYEDHW